MPFTMLASRPFNYLTITCCLLLCFALVACQTDPLPAPPAIPTLTNERLTIGVSNSAATVMTLTQEPFTDFIGANRLTVVTATTSTLLADLQAGQLDAVLVYSLPPDQGLWFNPVALDGVVLIVHPDNPVQQLTTAEAQALFNGRFGEWSALNGPALPVHLLSREQGASVRTLVRQRIMAEQRFSISSQLLTSNNAVLDAVASDPGTVGYTVLSAITGDVKVLSLNGVTPTLPTITSQEYVLTTPLYFVTRQEPTGLARTFLAWLQSDSGQQVIGAKYGRVSFSP